jgi:hypothetical protein
MLCEALVEKTKTFLKSLGIEISFHKTTPKTNSSSRRTRKRKT